MQTRLLPALVAAVFASAIAVLLFVPYVARQYRRRGELGPGHVALAGAGLLHALALAAYALVPFPQASPVSAPGTARAVRSGHRWRSPTRWCARPRPTGWSARCATPR